jgi:hypothetical protein
MQFSDYSIFNLDLAFLVMLDMSKVVLRFLLEQQQACRRRQGLEVLMKPGIYGLVI